MRTTTSTGSSTAAFNGYAPRTLTDPAAPRRNRQRIALGALLVALTTLAAVALYGSVGSRRPVLAIARGVDVGQTIRDADLVEVKISADPGLRPIPASRRSEVVGRTAAVPLVSGTLMTDAELGHGAALPPHMAVVGAVLKPGQAPVGLHSGQAVFVVTAPPANSSQPDTGQVSAAPIAATVMVVERGSDQSGTLNASLMVPGDAAPTLAVASADGRIRLVVTNS